MFIGFSQAMFTGVAFSGHILHWAKPSAWEAHGWDVCWGSVRHRNAWLGMMWEKPLLASRYLEGARWEMEAGCLARQLPKQSWPQFFFVTLPNSSWNSEESTFVWHLNTEIVHQNKNKRAGVFLDFRHSAKAHSADALHWGHSSWGIEVTGWSLMLTYIAFIDVRENCICMWHEDITCDRR